MSRTQDVKKDKPSRFVSFFIFRSLKVLQMKVGYFWLLLFETLNRFLSFARLLKEFKDFASK